MPPELVQFHVPVFPRLDEFAGVWALEPQAARLRIEALRRVDLSAHILQAREQPPRPVSQLSKVPTRGGKHVAVITMTGLLLKQSSSLEQSTSTLQLRRDIRAAVRDPDVSAILLAIDSPGGTAAGTDDLAQEVKQARKSKPVWAQVEDLCASAAYFVASQAEKIFVNAPTAIVGSIGTLSVVYDMSAMAEKEGVKALVFATGPLKGAGVPGATVTPEQADHFQHVVDEIQKSFDRAVRLGRGLTEKQLEDVRSGGVWVGDEALRTKLIDGIQSFETTLDQVAAAGRSAASGKEKKTMDFAQFVQSLGLDPENLTPAQTVKLKELYARQRQAEQPEEDDEDDDKDLRERRRRVAVEDQRIADIRRICGSYADPSMPAQEGQDPVSVAAHGIREGWDRNRTELECLRLTRPKAPALGGRQRGGQLQASVLEAALLGQLRLPGLEKQYKPETLELADRHFKNLGLQQLLLLVAQANGYDCSPGTRIHNGNLREVLQHAFPSPRMGGGFTSVSLPGILGNVANKQLLAGYTEEDQTWREVSRITSATTFHDRTYYRMLDNFEYQEVGPSGELKHGEMSEESYTASLRTYGLMLALSRQQIINDDLGAYDDLRQRLGRGGAKKFNNLFWTQFLAGHSTFFTAARGNYITGATTTLLTDGVGLGLALKAFRQMKSPSGDGQKRINARPSILLAPPELEYAGDQLFMGEKLNVGSGPGETNTYANKYRPVVNAWLSDSAFTGFSATAWYLFRTDLPMMVVSFLNGQQTPIVESADADFDTLGIQFRGYHDFYANQGEYLCGVKSKGAA